MKKFAKIIVVAVLAASSALTASAQYYQAISQATNMLSTALQGGSNYRGFVDVSYIRGVGSKHANFLEFSTTQGIRYGSLFYMGLGAGVDVIFSDVNSTNPYATQGSQYVQTSVMIPLYTDFRLDFGQPNKVGFYIDCRIGAGFFVGNKYILVGDGYVNSSQSFYLKPSIGCRVPLSSQKPNYALNLGFTYQLLTNSYWYNPNQSSNITLNALGLNIGFCW